jgi:hypothetical protein
MIGLVRFVYTWACGGGVIHMEKGGGVGELQSNVQNGVKNLVGSYRKIVYSSLRWLCEAASL